MKSRFFIVFICLLPCLGTLAQPRLAEPEMYVGVHGGALATIVNWSPQVIGTKDVLKHALLSGNGGLVFRYSQHKCCGLQVEVNYMQRGWRENGYDSKNDLFVAYTRRLDYIEVPFLAHIYFGSPKFRGFVNLGPQVGYCFHESEEGTQHTIETTQYNPIEHPFDWGVVAGLGFYGRSEKAGLFQLEARFHYSMGHLYDNRMGAYFDSSNTMSVSLNLAYMLQIRSKHKSNHKQ